jgi:hypothetical protein
LGVGKGGGEQKENPNPHCSEKAHGLPPFLALSKNRFAALTMQKQKCRTSGGNFFTTSLQARLMILHFYEKKRK